MFATFALGPRLTCSRSSPHNGLEWYYHLQILTRIFLEDPCHGASVREMRDFPGPSSDAVLGWISALMDAHFTRLAIGGSLDTSVSSALGVLRQAATHQAEACEVLSEVKDRRYVKCNGSRRPQRSIINRARVVPLTAM